jgi:hypothetical protein
MMTQGVASMGWCLANPGPDPRDSCTAGEMPAPPCFSAVHLLSNLISLKVISDR